MAKKELAELVESLADRYLAELDAVIIERDDQAGRIVAEIPDAATRGIPAENRAVSAALAAVTGFTGRWLLGWHRCRTGGHTAMGELAARTHGVAALPVLVALAGDCWQEHGDR